MSTRRQLLAASTASFLALPAIARAAEYPDRPITLVIGYAPGALTDTMVRLVAEKMAQELGQPVVVENRTGAATAIASTAVANARPAGHTLLIGTNSLAINPALMPGATPKDPLKELEPIGEVYYSPFVLLARKGLPARTLPELIELAKRKPGELNYGSSGSGSVNHLLTELLLQRAGIEITHIPYRGGGPALVELRSGRIDLFYATPLDSQPLLGDGAAQPIVISSPQRIPMMPDLPSVSESFQGCDGVLWQGLFCPPGTPEPIRRKLFTVLRKVLEAPALRQNVEARGVVLMDGDAAALRQRLAAELRVWPEVIRQGGIQPG
ncbi:tripartite tricarboxylate transporter substrate binding protein [Siccirubricoccus sp. KC 17139]|uniref:Tripartite tricarboxylate transporter substrate binding protein n=1 Tax=Siccirubricoccus soli TaxID=2899147 RepID=A0ABT1D8A9_9PROT|nr:tripartite tricarboxylate transporter substrate-binding protein [Siccirubricoccus soli]MCO6418176.1 tripartite tricarboxylate transporter substrate binding protein [Siccirubricoccus soli]MCP2684311.1 tripartite tricarboxylate transporter substrate-binding protein [Siccirubricoccus soli]